MELRRALLLFAIVLGIAAVVSSLARPPVREERGDRGEPSAGSAAPSQPTASAGPATRGAPEIRFVVGGKRKTETLKAGAAATVTVSVEEPGGVSIDGLDHLKRWMDVIAARPAPTETAPPPRIPPAPPA